MSTGSESPVTSLVRRFLPRLRYPYLFIVLASLLLVNLLVPDPVPVVDELILAVLTLLSATLTTRRDAPPRDGGGDGGERARLSPGDTPRSDGE